MKTINNILKETFEKSDNPIGLPELYLIVIKQGGHPNSKTTKDSVRGLIRNLMDLKKIKRVRYATYVKT